MMIGPAPMMRIDWMSVRFGMGHPGVSGRQAAFGRPRERRGS
jgi:hypothetical protein